MTTVLDILKGALRKIGQYAPGETLDSDDAADALEQFQAMLDMWSIEHLAIFNNVETVFNLIPGKQTYTVGTGGEINTTRPLRLSASSYTRLTTASSTIDYTCDQIAFDQYSSIGLKSQPGPWPKIMYYNTGFPLATLTFWPVPTAGYEFHLWSDMVFSDANNLSTPISMPQGYVLGLQTNLACLLAPEYGVQPSAELKEQARQTKALIKAQNSTPQSVVAYDGAIAGRPNADAGWILSGGFNY